ncbi:hypothetical protein SEA_CLAYDA5_6 [Microbacterium phage Clayda5]|nr:hypothetical protein SEA_CLAYDA5_6 [Microbacterium phage Clayda5]
MALKKYRLHGHDYLFDSEDVPEGAELIGERGEKPKVVLFPDQSDRKRGRGKANKSAPAPENKGENPPADDKADNPADSGDED